MSERPPSYSRRFFREWLAPQGGWFLIGFLLAALTAAAAAGYVEITRRAVDWLQVADVRVLTVAPVIIIALVIVRAVTLYGQTQANNTGVQRAMVGFQQALFSRLIDGDYARLQAAASGEYVSQFINDVGLVREASLRVMSSLAKSVLTIIGAVAMMFWLDWAIALLLLVVYPLAFWPVVKLGQRIRRYSLRAQHQAGEVTAFLGEAFQGARTVKAFNLEGFQKDRALKGFRERARLYMKILRSKALVDPFLEVLGGFALAGLFALAGWRAMNGETTVSELVAFIAAIGIASPEVRGLGTLNSVLNEGLAAADRAYRVIDAPAGIVDADDAKPIDRAAGEIVFSDVSFGYGAGGAAVKGLTFRVTPGQTVALVGPSGAGKSTVFNLLLRLYDPDGGTVQLDGADIKRLKIASLRAQVALVSQDAFLFDASIRENIALGRHGAGDADIKAAAHAAACDFIDTLPEGWDTQVGEGGRNLSGGQRQRVALARALLSGAPVLLLDEATSALDSESEGRVQAAIARLAGQRTILVIAHRLATVRRADRIFVLEEGRVSEEGSHEELVARGGTYARLSKQQLM